MIYPNGHRFAQIFADFDFDLWRSVKIRVLFMRTENLERFANRSDPKP